MKNRTMALKSYKIFFALALVTVLVLSWVRLYFGVELTDEAYAIAETRLMAYGGVPYINIWTQVPGHTLFYFWLEPLFTTVTGGLTGYFLFVRQASMVIKTLVLLICFFILRKDVPNVPLGFFLLLFLPFSTNNFYALSYNTLSLLFLILSSACIIKSYTAEIYYLWSSFFAGVIMSFACFAQQSLVFAALPACLILLFYGDKQSRLKRLGMYIFGGGAGTFTLLSTLIIMGGGIHNFFFGLERVLDSPYFHSYNDVNLNEIRWKVSTIFSQMYILIKIISITLIIAFIKYFLTRTQKASPGELRRIVFVVFCYLSMGYIVIISVLDCLQGHDIIAMGIANQHLFGTMAYLPVILYLFIEKRKIPALFLLFFWMPIFLYVFASSVTSRTGVSNRWFLFFPCMALSVIFFVYAMTDAFETVQNGRLTRVLTGTLRFAFPLILVFSMLISAYAYVFRDDAIHRLTYRVEEGIYKGIFTSETSAKDMLDLEREIRINTSTGERVLFLDIAPMSYLMTDAIPFTPTTWDPMLSNYPMVGDYERSTIVFDYFDIENGLPDKIIYVYWERDLSIFDDSMKFTQFVKENYNLTYESKALSHPIYVYERKVQPN